MHLYISAVLDEYEIKMECYSRRSCWDLRSRLYVYMASNRLMLGLTEEVNPWGQVFHTNTQPLLPLVHVLLKVYSSIKWPPTHQQLGSHCHCTRPGLHIQAIKQGKRVLPLLPGRSLRIFTLLCSRKSYKMSRVHCLDYENGWQTYATLRFDCNYKYDLCSLECMMEATVAHYTSHFLPKYMLPVLPKQSLDTLSMERYIPFVVVYFLIQFYPPLRHTWTWDLTAGVIAPNG